MKRLLSLLLFLLAGIAPAAADSVLSIPLPTKDLVYDPVRGLLHASVPGRAGSIGNSVIALDPEKAALGVPLWVGSEPGKLALSDDGRSLYVALAGAAAVRRVDLAAQRAELQFPVGREGLLGDIYFALDMEVLPGRAGSVAISRFVSPFSTAFGGVAVYDDGVPRPNIARLGDSRLIEFSESPSRLYGHDNLTTSFAVTRLQVDDSGVSFVDTAWNLTSGFNQEMEFDNGLLYMSSGTVIDPEAERAVGTCPGIRLPALVRPDSSVGRIFFLTGEGPTRALLAFDMGSLQQVGSLAVPGVSGKASSLVRFGTDGLAFRTDDNQLFLIRTALVPAPVLTLSFSHPSVGGGNPATGIVTLRRAAPEGGALVRLVSSDPAAASVPASIRVPAGATSATFALTTMSVREDTSALITASADGGKASARLLVLAPVLDSFTLRPETVPPGGSVTAAIGLSAPAPVGGVTIQLSQGSFAGLSLPASVTVPAGVSTMTIAASAAKLDSSPPIEVTATDPRGTTLRARVRIVPPALRSLTVEPAAVTAGATATGTVTLAGPAPAGGARVGISVLAGNLSVPSEVLVPEGAVSATFPIRVSPDVLEVNARIVGYYGVHQWASFEIREIRLAALTLGGGSTRGGETVAGVVTLDTPAPSGGLPIRLQSDQPELARVPESIQIPAGGTRGEFSIITSPVPAARGAVITASRGASMRKATLALLPPAVASLSLQPGRVTGGQSATGTVTMTGPAPAGDTVVALLSSDPAVRVPASIRVPAGEISAPFPVTTEPGGAATPVQVTAAAGGGRATATLEVRPAAGSAGG